MGNLQVNGDTVNPATNQDEGSNITGKHYQNKRFISQNGKKYDVLNLPEGFVVDGDLDLSHMGLTQLPDLSTITVKGNFFCSHNELTSLKGAPKHVLGRVYCNYNHLKSLLDMPECEKFCADKGVLSYYNDKGTFMNSIHIDYKDLVSSSHYKREKIERAKEKYKKLKVVQKLNNLINRMRQKAGISK